MGCTCPFINKATAACSSINSIDPPNVFVSTYEMPASKVLVFLLLAVVVATAAATTTCVPTMERLLSCLDFIEHRSDAVPPSSCAQLNTTVAEQPCCLMHVLHSNVAQLVGPEFDTARAMVNVTTAGPFLSQGERGDRLGPRKIKGP
ncbi:hypothetical protein GUJ93_ZPchr0007g3688 [Zizania palustris]|uniref:Bifunctional inhibitor/plant lipid transfer protein/seed storage helical domain-containing protein n=1 Tax=Zizania palustris TaxID=103762 RepID=A0A8J5VQ12_ZIZPA|nr:hypothetical protein GUJ93_ZPchr0007g3688 [Zizania palustris]